MKVQKLSAGDEWIVDGNYSGTLDLRLGRSQAVVLMDFPPLTCLGRVVRRRLGLGSEARTELPEGCPDKLDLEFLWWIAMYRRASRPKVLRRIARHPHLRLWTLRSDRDVGNFLDDVQAVGVPRVTSGGTPGHSLPL